MRRRKILAIGITLLFSAIATAQGETEELLSSVNSHIKEGDTKKAIKMLHTEILKDAGNYQLLAKRADMYRSMGRHEEAMAEVKKVLSAHPDYIPALMTVADLSIKTKDLEGALAYIEHAFELNTDTDLIPSLYALKGKILLYNREYPVAEECLMVASAADDVSLDTMCELAEALKRNDKLDEAIVVLESSIERFGIQMKSLVLAGSVENKMGDYDSAIGYLDLALAIDGENPTALALLAEAYMYIDDLSTAEIKLTKAIESDATSSYAHKIYGDLLMKNEDLEGACGEYNLAVQNGFAEDYGQVEILFLLTESCQLD